MLEVINFLGGSSMDVFVFDDAKFFEAKVPTILKNYRPTVPVLETSPKSYLPTLQGMDCGQ